MPEDEIRFVLSWWKKAYIGLRRWAWVPLGFVLIVLSFVLGGAVFRRREGKVITPLQDIKEKVIENNREIDIEIERAREAHVVEVQRIEREHAAQVQKLTEDQDRRRRELRRNPKKLAKWLTRLARKQH